MVQVRTLIFYRTENNMSNFCVIISENKKKTLGWGIAEVSLPLEEIKNTKAEIGRTMLGKQFLIVFLSTMTDQAILWKAVHIFSLFSLKSWHASPAMNYGKLLVLFFLKIFPAPTTFSFFFWFAPDDSLRENKKTLTAPIS